MKLTACLWWVRVLTLIFVPTLTLVPVTHAEEYVGCNGGVWPFTAPCSGPRFGWCNGTNNACECLNGVVTDNDFVLQKGCLTNGLSRVVLGGLLAFLSLVAFIIAVVQVIRVLPFNSMEIISPKSVGIVLIPQFICTATLGILVLCGQWIMKSTAMTLFFLFKGYFSAISAPQISLCIVQITYSITLNDKEYKPILLIYIFASVLYTGVLTIILFLGHFSTDIMLRQIIAHCIPGIYTALLFFWGFYGLRKVVQMDNIALQHSNNTARAQEYRQSLYSNCIGCIFTGCIGAIGTLIPHWYGHIYLLTDIIGAIVLSYWMINFIQPPKPKVKEVDDMVNPTTTTSDVKTIP